VLQLAFEPLGVVPLRSRTRHPFAVSAPKGVHRRLSLWSPASLETIRWGPRELTLCRPVGYRRDLAGCAL